MALTPQCQKVVAYIERWGSLNSIEAITHYGITRLAARIHDLKYTNRAMKAVPAENAAKGFVKYVPDFEQRRANLKRRMYEELETADGIRLAELHVKYAAKFSLMNIKEREHA
ncbi:helix-turn-helix domain-containing protein [Amphritea sp. HPY]|uniref:helix-turn-helix domain-containing protein n=1 Tax=Amphritea sp. HPY TaxID=3421652 RepID=UPI003D7EF81D